MDRCKRADAFREMLSESLWRVADRRQKDHQSRLLRARRQRPCWRFPGPTVHLRSREMLEVHRRSSILWEPKRKWAQLEEESFQYRVCRHADGASDARPQSQAFHGQLDGMPDRS